MKKLALALVCLVSVAFFASCDPTDILDPAPTITVMKGADYISSPVENPFIITLDDNTDYKYGFHVESNAQTKKELDNLKVSLEYTYANGETGSSEKTLSFTGLGFTSYDFEEKVFESKVKYDAFTVRATVTDADNQVSTATIAYKIETADNLVAQPFTWTRTGTQAGTGLEQFGLKWEKNVQRGFYAKIEPLSNDVKFYNIKNLSTWDNITTETQKANLFTELLNAEPINSFVDLELSGYANGNEFDRNFLLATIYNNNYYLIRIQKTSNTTKNTYTIKGEYK